MEMLGRGMDTKRKKEHSKNIEQLIIYISLKTIKYIFFIIMSLLLVIFLLKNEYIHASVETGRISVISECIAYPGVVT